MIRSKRLDLIPARPSALAAELRGGDRLAAELKVAVPPSWPPDLHDDAAVRFTLDRLRAHPEEGDWWLHYFLDRELGTLVGAGGFKGPPCRDGVVEIGYSVLAEFRRRGYAAEASFGLIGRAFEQPDVEVVVGETLASLEPSIGVLEKCGFKADGSGAGHDVIRFRLRRDEFEAEVAPR